MTYMKNYFWRSALTVSLVLAPVFLPIATLRAQGTEGIQVKPAVIEENIRPGGDYQFTVTVTNISETDQIYYLSTQDITGLDEHGLPKFAPPGQATNYELSNWIVLSQQTLTLKSHESKSLPFTVRVPAQAAPGSHFGGIFFDTSARKPTLTGAGVGLKVGAILSLRIAGDVVEDAALREFSTEKFVYNEPTVNFNSRVENKGNALLRPHGIIEISDMLGRKTTTINVNDSAAPIFPGGNRIYTTAWSSEYFAFGRYQAILSIVYGEDSRKTISMITSFWVLPLKPILIGLGIILGVICSLYIYVRIIIQRKLREMGVSTTKKGEMDYYAKRYRGTSSRLVVIALVLFLVCVVVLAMLFLLFA